MIQHYLDRAIRKSQGLRFILVGGVNTLFGYSIFALFIYAGLHYVLAALLSTTISALFNFITIGNFVFNRAQRNLLWRFILVYVIVYFVGISALKIGSYFSQNVYFNGVASLPFTATIAFLLNKYFVFERKNYETN